MKVVSKCKCYCCEYPLDIQFIGTFEETAYIYYWSTIMENIFATNASYIKKVDGKVRRVCVDCFYYIDELKIAAFQFTRNREIGKKVPKFYNTDYCMSADKIDFWMRSMINEQSVNSFL